MIDDARLSVDLHTEYDAHMRVYIVRHVYLNKHGAVVKKVIHTCRSEKAAKEFCCLYKQQFEQRRAERQRERVKCERTVAAVPVSHTRRKLRLEDA